MPTPRRHLASVLVTAVAALTLTACGGEDEPGLTTGDTFEGLDAVEISGDFGSEPEVEWAGQMDAGDLASEVLTQGDGPEVTTDSRVIINYYLGNGFSQRKTLSTYDENATGELITYSPDFSPVFVEALEGRTVGSRIAVTGSAEEAFGDFGNPELGIGNQDTVLLIMDISSAIQDKVNGEREAPPAWVPVLGQKAGKPTRFGFAKTPQPIDKLQVARTITGDGPEVKKGDLIVVNYLGQTFDGKKPFDESYSSPEPASFPIGNGSVIKGWDEALVGQPVGSRVFLSVPPAQGYGKAGQPAAGIEGDDTLFFVIDILGAG